MKGRQDEASEIFIGTLNRRPDFIRKLMIS